MPRIVAATNAEQRELTKRKVLDAFGELLFSHGLPGLTMTDVARHAEVGRTAIYNYFADLEQLLVAYALDETGKFITEMRRELADLDNPVDRLAAYVKAQILDLTKRHLPPGPAMRSVMSEDSFRQLAAHVDELNELLEQILREGMKQGYLPEADVPTVARLIHGSLSANANRAPAHRPASASATPAPSINARVETSVRFIQAGAGARFDDAGRPARVYEQVNA